MYMNIWRMVGNGKRQLNAYFSGDNCIQLDWIMLIKLGSHQIETGKMAGKDPSPTGNCLASWSRILCYDHLM